MFSRKKVGGIWFIKLGPLGFSFWVSKKKSTEHAKEINGQQITLFG